MATKRHTYSFPTVAVLAAAAAAHRINGNYLKWSDDPAVNTNRELVLAALTGAADIVTDADREEAENIRRYFRRIVFQMLSGSRVSPYERSISQFIDNETITSMLEIAIAASMPQAYKRGMQQRTVTERINFARGGALGTVGNRLEVKAEILQSFYSQQWNCYFITAITDADQVVRWSTSTAVEIGTTPHIRGTLKSYENNVNKLGRVKPVTVKSKKQKKETA